MAGSWYNHGWGREETREKEGKKENEMEKGIAEEKEK